MHYSHLTNKGREKAWSIKEAIVAFGGSSYAGKALHLRGEYALNCSGRGLPSAERSALYFVTRKSLLREERGGVSLGNTFSLKNGTEKEIRFLSGGTHIKERLLAKGQNDVGPAQKGLPEKSYPLSMEALISAGQGGSKGKRKRNSLIREKRLSSLLQKRGKKGH